MEENSPSELILKMNGREYSWKGPWDADMEDLLDAFYGLLVGATFSAKMIPEWMKEWVEDHVEESPEEDDVVVPEDDSKYGPDGRLKVEDGLNGYYANGTPVPEYNYEESPAQVRDDMDS